MTAMERAQGGFAQRLRAGTTAAHRQAESGAFVKGLLCGEVSREAYGRFVLALHVVYQALERELRAHRHDPRIGPLVFAEVERVASLEADLAFFGVAASAEPLAAYGEAASPGCGCAPSWARCRPV